MTLVRTLEGFAPPPRGDSEPFTLARIEEGPEVDGPWTVIDTITLDPVDPDPAAPITRMLTTELATLAAGWYRVTFIDGDGDETQASEAVFASDTTNSLRVMIPRVRRAIDGPLATSSAAASATLNDAQVKNLIADAIAEVIWYAPEWGKTLTVVGWDSGVPDEYEIEPALNLPEQTVVVTQAALDYFFHEFRDKKVSQTISNEAQSWTYQLSANLLTQQFEALRKARDAALERITALAGVKETYSSFLAVRDADVAHFIEPWVEGSGMGGQQLDWRFG